MRALFISGVGLLLAACSSPTDTAPDVAFLDNLSSLCGGTYSGSMVSDQSVDADWAEAALVVGPVSCDAGVVRMPLAVGEDTSRTWVVSRGEEGLEFRHEHVEPDGSPSAVTQYGGYARGDGTATRQAFPADELTRENFIENDIPESVPNVWTLTFEDGVLGYALARPATETAVARDFRAEFDIVN